MTASISWLMAGATVGFAPAASATQPQPQPQPSATTAPASTDNGVRIYIDPATGKTRQATRAERAEEAIQSAQAARLREGRGVQYRKRADGAIRALDLEGRLMESVVVTLNADGSLSYQHVAGDASTVQPVAPATTLEEK